MTQTSTITIKDPKAPATSAQVSYLTNLIQQQDCPVVAERFAFSQKMGFLSKGAASALITEAKAAPKKPYQPKPIVQDDGAVAMMAASAPAITMPEFGYYEIDGTFYYWDVTGKDAYPALRRLTVITNYDGTKKGSWKKIFTPYKPANQIEHTFTPYAGKGWSKSEVTKKVTVPQVLLDGIAQGAKPLTSDMVGAKGKAFGFCVRCGATLTDPVSVAQGIGPVCITYWT